MDDYLAAKSQPDSLWDYELDDYANPEYRQRRRRKHRATVLEAGTVRAEATAVPQEDS